MDGAAEWLAVDWGTTRLRVWAMRGAEALDRRDSADGMGGLPRDGFEPALLRLADGWIGARCAAVICGMAGSREGWAQAPYLDVGEPLETWAARAVSAPVSDPRLSARILPGLRQTDPPDVMRGEETQLLGLSRDGGEAPATACLPGTHSKWVRFENGRPAAFQTWMTGEMFDALCHGTVLRHATQGEGWDEAAFEAAARMAAADPARALGRLFSTRAGVLTGVLAGPAQARAHLSGLLIGAEVAGASAPGATVTVLGDGALQALYLRALELTGRTGVARSAEAATLAGLAMAHEALKETLA